MGSTPRENPVLTTWVTEAHAGGTIVNNYFGAYRGWGTGTNQYEADLDTLKQCSSREGNTGIWIDGNMHTITELQG